MGELTAILVGMMVGGIFAAVFVEAMPDLPRPAQAGSVIVGALLGAAAAYVLMWLAKRPTQPPAVKKPERPHRAQVVGSKCAACGQRMIMITDGNACPYCNRVYCQKCQPQMPCADCRKPIQAELVGE